MLQVARLAPTLLGESKDLVVDFLRGAQNTDGGFRDRAGGSDLYYTVFGLEGLLALHQEVPASAAGYLAQFGDGGSLDLVHMTCLARAWGIVDRSGPPAAVRDAIARRLDRHRSSDGGFALAPSAERGTAYACFLALGAIEDLGIDADLGGVGNCLQHLRSGDGAYANHPGAGEGSTPATAAAVLVLHHLGETVDPAVAEWLISRCHPDGGFFASPRTPIPDLLSTATSLHALSALHVASGPLREPCLDFVDTLWTSAGGFYGNWTDQTLDCEYTYYGLLALGHLSL